MTKMRGSTTVTSLTFLAAALLASPSSAVAQPSALESATRALALIDSSIVAHGGAARLRAIEDVSIRFRGTRQMAYQSETLTRPWTTQPTEVDLVIDFRNNRIMRHGINRYPRDFAFDGTVVTTPQGSFYYDPSRAGLGDAFVRFPGGPVATHQARRELPALQILLLRDHAESLRWLGSRGEGGARLTGVSYAEPDGAVYELWLDAATKRLIRLEWLRDDPVDGDQLASYTYSGYRVEKGIPVPSRLVECRNGELVRDDSLAIAIDTRPADALFAPPASGYTEIRNPQPGGAAAEPVKKLADNVWLLQQLPGGNRVMFVAFRDYVLVFETPTPQEAATAVLEAVRRTVPGKPVRYAAFTHHHDDHGGGLRPYIAEGVTIVTTPSNRAFVEHVAKTKHTLRPDALSTAPRAPVVETFTGKRVFTDGEMAVELHDIGPTSHVDEIVMAWLPREKLVFQGDLLILPDRGEPGPANSLTVEFARAIDSLGLDVQTIAGVHGRVGTIAELRAAVARRGK
jgi:glyoxylase-like metal-dependent hydrolase (beta-lactamase superfamily II)